MEIKFFSYFGQLRGNRANIKGLEICLNRAHIPEVDGSNPLPPTNHNKGLEDISQASSLFFYGFSNRFLKEFGKMISRGKMSCPILDRAGKGLADVKDHVSSPQPGIILIHPLSSSERVWG